MVLDGDVFDVPIRKDIVHRVVRWQLAKRQQVHAQDLLYHLDEIVLLCSDKLDALCLCRGRTQLKPSVKSVAQEESLTNKKELEEHGMEHYVVLRLVIITELYIILIEVVRNIASSLEFSQLN